MIHYCNMYLLVDNESQYCTVTLQAPSSELVRNVTVYLSLFVTSRNDAERPHLPENLYLCVCVYVLWGHTWKYTAPT